MLIVFALSSFIKVSNFVLYSSIFCRIFSTVLLKFELVSLSISYAEIRAFPASLRLKPQQERLAQMHKDSLRLSHKARLPPAAPVARLDCPTREALAQLKRSMALCRHEYDLEN
jgi:hypothetical protein